MSPKQISRRVLYASLFTLFISCSSSFAAQTTVTKYYDGRDAAMALNYDTELYMAGMIHSGGGYNPTTAANRAQATLDGWPNIIADCELYDIPVSFNICGYEAVFGDAGISEVHEIDVYHSWHADPHWATNTWYSDMPTNGGNYQTVGNLSGYTRSYELVYGGLLTEQSMNSDVPFEISYHNFGHESLSNISEDIMNKTFAKGVEYHKRIGSKLTAECPPWNNNPQSTKYYIYVDNGIFVFNRSEGATGQPYEVIPNLWIVPRNGAFNASTDLTTSIDSVIANGHVLAPYSHPEDGFNGSNRTGFQTSLAYARTKVDSGQLWATTLSEIGRYWEAKSDVSTTTQFVEGKTIVDIDLIDYDALRFGIPYLTFVSPMPDSSPYAQISVNYPDFQTLNSESPTVRVVDANAIYTIYLDPYNTTTVEIEGISTAFAGGVEINTPILSIDSTSPVDPNSGTMVTIEATAVSTDDIYSVNLIYQCNSEAKDSRILDYNPSGYWETQVGPFAEGDSINYYVSVTDNSGRREVSTDKNFSIALGPDAIAPQWQNQGQSSSTPPAGGSVQLYADGLDDRALRYATLATDETGSWEKKTSAYGSPMDMGDLEDTWVVSDFTWSNPAIPAGTTVSWRIYYEDADGNETATDIMSFTLQEPDTEGPSYFDPSHSSTLMGTLTELSLRWTDNVALDEYVFSYDDGSGTFVDDPAVKFTPKDGWWDENWSYRREIMVDNTAGTETLTDHTVLISVDTATLISNNKLNPYAGDIRFVDPNGPTELAFWVESGLNTADTRIWIEIPEVAAGDVHTVYMYYGSANHRVLQSDGKATFVVFDDFGGRGWEEYKYINNPVMGPGSSAGGSGVFSSVLRESETFWRMYASYDSDDRDIGLSTSTDGIDWTHQGVVLRKGASGEWDSSNIWCPTIWKENGIYYLLYSATGPGGIKVGLATSTDGVTFTKHPGNPVFEDPDWAAGNTEGPCLSLLKEDGVYYITYNTLGGHRRLSFASSTDLVNWARVYDYPRFAENTTSEWNYNSFCGNVFKYDDLFYLIIPGQDSSRDYAKFGMYVSSSPVFPEDDTEFKGIVMIGNSSGWEGEDMDTPWVVQFDDKMYMYYAACGSCWSQTGMTLIDDIPFALMQAYPPGNYIGADRSVTVSQQIMPPVGWEKSIVGYDDVGGQNFEITLDPAVTGRAVVMQDANDLVPLELYRDFSSLSSGSVSAWVRTNTLTGDYDLDLYGDAQTVTALSVGFDSNGNFHYWNGSYVDTGVTYATDTWYRIQVDFDVATDKYTFAVYDMSFAELLKVDNIDFGVGVTAGIDSIHFHTSASFNGSAYLDDVRITALADTEPVVSVSSELTPDLTESWSVVTKTLTSDLGATIRWKVTASDTSGNTTTSDIYSFTTSAPDLPPVITLDSPDDNFWSSSASVTFTATCTDDVDISSVSLYGDWGGSWALIDTHSDPNNGQPVSFMQTLPEGHWTWAIECTDNAAQTVTSLIRTIHVDATPQTWWHSGYSYRKRMIVTENAGRDLANYPVHLTLDTASLITSGKMQGDCNDIRITYNGVEIPSQVVNPNSSQTQVWFQIDLSASQTDYEVYLYYGNPTASAPDYGSQSSISWDGSGLVMDTGKITATFNGAGGIINQIKHNTNNQELMPNYDERGLGYLFSNNPAVYYIFRDDETDDSVVLTEDGPILKTVTAYSGESPQWIQQNTFYNNQGFIDFKVIRPAGASSEKYLVGANNITPDGVFSSSDNNELLRVDNSVSDITVSFDNAWKYNPTTNLGYVGLTDPSFTNQLALFWDNSLTSDFTWKPRTSTGEVGTYSLFIGGNGVTNTYGTIDSDAFDYRFVLSYSDTPNNGNAQAGHDTYSLNPPTVTDSAEEPAPPDETAPVVIITSPINTTYGTSSVTLEYTVSEAVSSCSYSLNGDPNVVITVGESVTLGPLVNDTYELTVYATDFAGNTGSASVTFTVEVAIEVPDTWWNTDWSYRVPVSIDAADYDRTNEPIEHAINFTQLFDELGQSGLSFDINSVRVAAHQPNGVVIGEVPSQFDTESGYDAATNAAGTIVWIMSGTTSANTARSYYIYFDSIENLQATPAYETDLNWDDTTKVLSNTNLDATIANAGTGRSGIASFKYQGTEYLTHNGMVYIDGAPSTYQVLIDGPVKKTIKLTAAVRGDIEVTVYDLAEFVRVQGHITGSGWSFTPFPYLWYLSTSACTNTLSYYDDGTVKTVSVGGDGWLGHAPQEGWASYAGVGTNKDFCLVTDSSTLSLSNNMWKNNSGGQQLMMPGFNPNLTFPINPNSWIVPTDTYQDGRDFWNKLGSPVSVTQGDAENQTVTATYDLTISAGPNGSIDPNGLVTVDQGTNQLFTATPDIGYEVDKWSLDGSPVQNGGVEFTLNNIVAAHTVSVTFKRQTFAVTAASGANGSIDPNGVVSIDYGSDQVFTATPDTDYKVNQWSVDDGPAQTGGMEFTLSTVTTDQTVNVTFRHIADLYVDGVIDVYDLQILANNWLADVSLDLDIYDDGKMDMADFSVIAEHWLQEL